MARLNSVSDTWEEYKGWGILALFIFLIYCFRNFFLTIGDAAGSGAQSVLGGIAANAQVKADKAKAKAANGGKVSFTDEQVAEFNADAQSLAVYFGHGPLSLETVIKDQGAAFTMLKQKYSRLRLFNNKPYYYKPGTIKNGKGVVVSQNEETAASQKNAINWRVLAPAYKEASGGHDLQADARYYITDSDRKKLLKWIL